MVSGENGGGVGGKESAYSFFNRVAGLLLRFHRITHRTRGNLPVAYNVTSREVCH